MNVRCVAAILFIAMTTNSGKSSNAKICLLGASFETGNLGVNALAESAIKCILHQWPDAEIMLLDSGRKIEDEITTIGDKELQIKKLPIRFSKNIFLENHFVVLCFYALLFKVFRGEKFKRFCTRRNACLESIVETDMVADITGGDSFSDIYGMRRFIIGFLRKWLVLLFNKNLIMLPQTYGPFKRPLAKTMAKYILNHAGIVYSRDRAGIEYVNTLLDNRQDGKVRFTPDVAFVLDPRRPEGQEICSLEKIRHPGTTLIGLNVSGLLACCGNAEDNVFGIKTDYLALTDLIIKCLMERDDTAILLIPHSGILPEPDASPRRKKHKKGYREMADAIACAKIYEHFSQKYNARIFLVHGQYSHNETKYIIGLCDFFIGSRMHACIAALSQGIPAVGLAYSKKFKGVFESVGVEELVVDMRQQGQDEILAVIENALERRDIMAERLRRIIPDAQARILNMFKVSEL